MATNFKLRKADENDILLINQLASKVWYHTYSDVHSQEQLEYMFAEMYSPDNLIKQMSEGHTFYIGYDGETPVGYMSIHQKEKDLFYLEKLYVMPEAQGTGAGKFLFKAAIKAIKTIHPRPCILELNVNRKNKAIEFYQRMGMEKFREVDTSIGGGYMMNSAYMRMRI